jgi:hypothetical protein
MGFRRAVSTGIRYHLTPCCPRQAGFHQRVLVRSQQAVQRLQQDIARCCVGGPERGFRLSRLSGPAVTDDR